MKKYLFLLAFGVCCLSLPLLRAQNTPTSATGPTGTAASIVFPVAMDSPSALNITRRWLPNFPITDTGDSKFKTSSFNYIPVTTVYTDGRGRTMMSIKHGKNLVSKDVIQVFDTRSTATRFGFMPYPVSNHNTRLQYNLHPLDDQQTYYNSVYPNESGTSYIATTGSYNSGVPASVTFKSGLSFVGQNVGDTATMTFNKASDSIIKFYVNDNGVIDGFGTYYAPGVLTVRTGIGQNGKRQQVYYDANNKIICKRIFAGTRSGVAKWLTTYYAYNSLGRLAFVMPPKTVASHPTSYSSTLLSSCFSYRYDKFGGIIEKRLPDKSGVENEVYDSQHKPVLYQTPLMKDEGKWAFTIYDAGNRPVITGLVSDTNSRATWQSWADGTATPGGGVSSGSLLYYILNGVAGTYPSSISSCDINSIKYYDTYPSFAPNFDSSSSSDYLTGPRFENVSYYGFTQGMLTASQVRIQDPSLSTPTYITYVYFYDFKGRLIQTQVRNAWNTGSSSPWDKTTIQYSFLGQKVFEIGTHNSWSTADKASTKIIVEYDYDEYYNRLNSVEQKIDSGPWRNIASYTYDDLGNVKQKNIGGIEKQDYSYNIRGQLESINADYVTTPTATDKTFGCTLNYDYGFTQPRLDGSISGMKWRGAGSSAKMRAYGYSYDSSGRLTDADFRQLDGGTWSNTTTDMSMNGVSYDDNGNILTMNQMGTTTSGPVKIDQLSYTYGSTDNHLLIVSDTVKTNYGIGDFQDVTPSCGLGGCPDYQYDDDGNMIADSNKHIKLITYNELDEPLTVTTDSGTITNVYDAGGTLIQKTIINTTLTAPSSNVYRYWGPYVYRNDTLQYALHQQGRARWVHDSSFFKYDFFVTDHLGNVRTVVTSDDYERPVDYFAGHEIASAALESSMFANLDAVRDEKPGSTNPYDLAAAHLNGSDPTRSIGTAILLRVMAGDKFDVSAESYWEADSANFENNADPSNMLSSIVSTLVGGVGGYGIEGSGAVYVNGLFTPDNYLGLYQGVLDSLTDSTAPTAYINYLVFDQQMNLVPEQSGAIQVSNIAGSWQVIGTTSPITVGQNGYLSVYMSCAAGMPVYMDKLSINYYKGRLLQEQNYYPHGLAVNEGMSASAPPSKYLFQSNEVHNENNINLADFNARYYDYQIGRFVNVDPMADFSGQESKSPYHAFAGNPANVVDPMGLDDEGDEKTTYSNLDQPVQDAQGNYTMYVFAGSYELNSDGSEASSGYFFDFLNPANPWISYSSVSMDLSDPGPSALASQGIDVPDFGPTVQAAVEVDGQAPVASVTIGVVGGLWNAVQGIGNFLEHPLDNLYNMAILGNINNTGILLDPQRYIALNNAMDQKMNAIQNQFKGGDIFTKSYMIGYGIGSILPALIAPESEVGEVGYVAGDVGEMTATVDVMTTTGSYSVYQGVDEMGTIRYVGITSRDPAVRFGEHLASETEKASLDYRTIDGATNLSRIDARVWEQNLINQYGGPNGSQLFNQINSVAPKFWGLYGINP